MCPYTALSSVVTLQSGAQGEACDHYIPTLSPPPVETHFSRTGGCKGLKTWGEGGSGSREVRRDAIPARMPRLEAMALSCSAFPPGQGMSYRKGTCHSGVGEAPCSRLCPGLQCKLKYFPFLHSFFFFPDIAAHETF